MYNLYSVFAYICIYAHTSTLPLPSASVNLDHLCNNSMLISGITAAEPGHSSLDLSLIYPTIQPLNRGGHRVQEDIKNENI